MTERSDINRTAWQDLPAMPIGRNGSSTAARKPRSSPRSAPSFPDAEPLNLSTEDTEKIVDTIAEQYRKSTEARSERTSKHKDYDLMFRGQMDFRGPSGGPWEDSSDLHIQLPYWVTDAYNTRLVSSIWSTNPLVVGHPTEDDDQEIAADSASLVKWHLGPRRMNARSGWGRVSKTRCIHGRGVGMVPWAKDEYVYRVADADKFKTDDDGNILTDDEGNPERTNDVILKRETRYDGPIIVPLEWDDVIDPIEGTNLQPVSPANPLGADWVGIRQWEPLSLIWKKRASSYPFIDDDAELKSRDDWVDQAPSQDRSGSGIGANNQERVKLQDRVEGISRNQAAADRSPRTKSNPEFEIITWFAPHELENELGELEEAECVFFFRVEPKALLGAFRLTDLQWRNRRPLFELDFQTVGNRRQSMGIMEIIADISAELDTIHNMRMDVGFFTNIPFFFYQATGTFDPDGIVLSPGKGIPVDDVRGVVFPQLQNVTSFFHQEEQLTYSLAERILGVTDLFLGVSPTKGAAARHATGFVGTQQEAMARTEEIQTADASAFSLLCHLVLEAEIQFGPDHRIIRLQSREGPLSQRIDRDQLWFREEYDFTLGPNYGLFSNMMRQEQSQVLTQLAAASPLINQDPGRRWEVENEILLAAGFEDPARFIGPLSAVSAGMPKEPDEENGEMDQGIYGVDQPSPVNPSDNDQEHMQSHQAHIASPAYADLGRPNLMAHVAHIRSHVAQIQQKQLMAQQQAMAAAQGGGQGMPGQPGPDQGRESARNVAALEGSGQAGQMGEIPSTGGSTMPQAAGPQTGGV